MIFFFFQAEDGIRDWSVTGVQTCALPIWDDVALAHDRLLPRARDAQDGHLRIVDDRNRPCPAERADVGDGEGPAARSEERRVGKECRYRGWRYDRKNKRRRKRTRTCASTE